MNADVAKADADGVPMATLTLTKAVFHRAGVRPEGSVGPCPSDCKAISIG